MLKKIFCGFLLLLYTISNAAEAYEVVIKSTAPAVLGARVNFTVELRENGKPAPDHDYNFVWTDNAYPRNTQSFETQHPYSNFSVIYDKSKYPAGTYEMEVNIQRSLIGIYISIARGSIKYIIDTMLSGNLTLIQNGTAQSKDIVSIYSPVNQTVSLFPSDAEFISNATSITTYWWLNCVYLGPSPGLSVIGKYDKENESYNLEALVEVSFEKIEPTTTPGPITTSTTTPSTTTTTSTSPAPAVSTTTSVPTTVPSTAKRTDDKPNASSSAPPAKSNGSQRRKREAEASSTASSKIGTNSTAKPKPVEVEISADEVIEVKQTPNTTMSPVIIETTTSRSIDDNFRSHRDSCFNISNIYHDPNKTYGYFSRKFVGKVPVGNLTITGSSWLQHGELLHLKIKCTGSKPLGYCVKIFEGPYNTTGNETCTDLLHLESCEFPFIHLFQINTPKTIAVIVQNDYNKAVTQVAVNFYKATNQSQLSVIIVPVSFCLVAVILVVFGVAYYIQNRNRYIIEVADFNFGDSQSVDMEYKTFQARLLDSIREVIPWPKRNLNADDNESHSGEDSSIKYGSMT